MISPHKIKADIYRLDIETITLSNEAYIDQLMQNHSAVKENHSYENVTLLPSIKENGFKAKLFINKNEDREPEWLNFIDAIVEPGDRPKVARLQRKYPSFILFVYSDVSIYAICRGAGWYVLDNKVEPDFGIKILERLIDPEESDIRSASERGVIGSILAANRFFKQNHKFTDERKFGKYYKGLEAFIKSSKLKSKLDIDSKRSSIIVGGESTLKLNSQVYIEEILKRISLLDALLKEKRKIPINKFRKLTNRSLNAGTPLTLKVQLEQELKEENFKLFKKGETIELYHPDIFKFLTSDSLLFKYDKQKEGVENSQRITFDYVFDLFGLNVKTQADFDDALDEIKTQLVFDQYNEKSVARPLSKWMSGEVIVHSRKYFKFDGDWYTYEQEFIYEIKTGVQELIQKIPAEEKLPNWPYAAIKKAGHRDNEHQYNLSMKSKDTIVCDKALINQIEVCDFLRITKDEIRFYHVKMGWGQSIRVVYNQIMNAAKIISEMRATNDRKKLKAYLKTINKHNYSPTSKVLLSEIDKILQPTKKITFILVYGCDKGKIRDQRIQSSRSNIAKMSVIECEYELRTRYQYNFEISQVKVI